MFNPPYIFSAHKCDDKTNGTFMVFSAWEMLRDKLPNYTLVAVDWGVDAEYYKNQTKDDYRVIWVKVTTHEEYLKYLRASTVFWGQFIDPDLSFLELEAISENVLIISDSEMSELELAEFSEKLSLDETLYATIINKQRMENEDKILKPCYSVMFKKYVKDISLDIKVLVYSKSKEALDYFNSLFKPSNIIQLASVDNNMYHNISNLRDCSTVQIISADLKGFYGFVWCCLFVLFKLIGKPTFLYWIGSDVTIADRRMLWFANLFITKHLAIAPWLVDELKDKGVSSEFYPNPVPNRVKHILPLPKKLTVLAYLGVEGNESFYGGEIIKKLIENTDYDFIVVGSKQLQKSKNLLLLGFIPQKDMYEIYAKSTVLVRITKHDGFSNMVQEALQSGRYVIWSKHYEYSIYAETYDDVVKSLKHVSEFTEPNYHGAHGYGLVFNDRDAREKFIKLYVEVLR